MAAPEKKIEIRGAREIETKVRLSLRSKMAIE